MSRRWLSWLVLLLVLSRAALVLACADVFFYGEELGKGAGAKALLDQLPTAYIHKNYGYHEGGGFVVTHLKALFFLAVGENVLAHKLAALLVTTLILLAGWKLVRTHWGERAALGFGLLFVFSPAAFLRFSLLGLGTHFEALLFIALTLHFALVIADSPRPRAREVAGLGLAAGFGLYCSLQTAPASACAAAWIVWTRRGRPSARELGLALLGLLLGLVPLFASVAQIGMAALRPAPQTAAPRASLAEALAGFTSALSAGDFFDWLYALAVPLAALVALRRSRPARVVALWMALFLALYFASGLATQNYNWFFYLRLAPLWFGGLVLIAAACATLAGRARRAAEIVVALLVLGGLFDLGALLADARPGALRENWTLLVRTQGYDFDEYLPRFLGHLAPDDAARIAITRRFEAAPELLDPALACALYPPPQGELADVLERWRAARGPGFEAGLAGFGLVVDPSFGHQPAEAFARILARPPGEREALAEGFGRIALGLKFDEDKLRAAAAIDAPAELRAAFLRGVGSRLYLLHRLRPDRARAFLESLPAEVREEFARGWRTAAALHTLR